MDARDGRQSRVPRPDAGARTVIEALRLGWPALTRLLGTKETARIAREFLDSRPFFRAGVDPLEVHLPPFLGVALEDDPLRGAWLPELARLEEARARAARSARGEAREPFAGAELLAFEHRVDELFAELTSGERWQAPRPVEVLLAVVSGPTGVRLVELSREDWSARARASAALPPALPRRGPSRAPLR